MSRVTRAMLGALANPAGLDTPAPGPAGRFRRNLPLAIPTGGGAQAATLAAGAVLRTVFAAREVDARAGGAPEPATLQPGPAGLVLTLPRARRLVRVRLAPAQGGDQVAAFRFDGQAVAEDPVAVGGAAAGGAALGVTDARLILRRRRGGADLALTAGEVASATLAYAPSNPRLGFVLEGDEEGETFLPPVTDAAGQPVFPATAERGADFARALADRLARRASLPASLALTLILEADEPCVAGIEALDLTLILERRGFLDGAEKRVLRFPGGRREVRALALPLPPSGATILSAGLTASLALDAAARLGGAAPAAGAPDPGEAAEGVALLPASPVATRLALQAALAATGAEAVLAAPEGAAEIVASVWEERDGLPGTRLAESAPVPVTGPRPVLVPFAFPRGVALPAGPAWLVLTARSGRALVLLAPGEGAVALGGVGGFTQLAAAAGRGAAAGLRSPASDPAGGGAPAILGLSVGGVAVPLQAAAGRRVTTADLRPALVGAGGASVELLVASDASGLVTLDPPVLRYTLG